MKNCLVDTHVLIWMMYNPNRLQRSVGMYLRDSEHNLHVSAVSLWEISIKSGLKKLPIVDLRMEELIDIIKTLEITLIELSPEEAASSIALAKMVHKDPFDRMIAWQAISRNLELITSDDRMAVFEPFGLKRFIPTDTDFLLNEEIEAYNAMVDEA